MEPVVLATILDEVTVYRQGARVRRTAVLERRDGRFPDQIFLDDLPPCLEDGTVRVRLESVDGAAPVPAAADTKVRLGVRDGGEKIQPDKSRRDELNTLKDREAALRERLQVLESSIDALDGITLPDRPAIKESPEPPPFPGPAFVELTKFVEEGRQARMAERLKAEDELEALGERVKHLQFLIQQEGRVPEVQDRQLKKGVAVRLQGADAAAEKARVILEYHVPGAVWSPSYSLHVDSRGESAELRMQALVAQATGEDWEDVRLRLSTALPQQWTELPELQSLRIGRRQAAPPKRGWREAPEGAEALYSDYDAFRGATPPQAPPPAPPPPPEPESCRDEEVQAKAEAPEADDREMMKEAKVRYVAGARPMAPPPCAAPPPAPSRAAAPMAKKMKADLFMEMQSSATVNLAAGFGGGAPGEAPVDAVEEGGPPVPGADLMDYGRLRMAGPRNARRGRLEVVTVGAYEGASAQALKTLNRVVSAAVEMPGLPDRFCRPESLEGFDYAYVCSTPVSVPSRAKYHNVPVLTQPATLKIAYVTVPREAQDVFRLARLTNPLAVPILPGPADIYLDGNFFVTTSLDTVAPKGRVDVGLGVEQAVKVARNTAFEEISGGVLGGKLTLKHDITVDVTNNLPREVELEVRERVPVKGKEDREIEIALRNVEPPWKEYREPPEEVRGRYAWTVKVPAGQKCRLRAGYDVHLSSRNEIVGGNRREA
jgi:hypothetical protein